MKIKLAALALSLAIATPALADKADDKKAFRTAYKSYQQAAAAGEVDDALKFARQAYEYGEKVYGPDHKNTAALTLNYGRLITKDKEALPIFKLAVKRYEKVYGKKSAELIGPLTDMAGKSNRAPDNKKASTIYKRALSLVETHFPDDKMRQGKLQLEVGKSALNVGERSNANRYLTAAKKTFETQPGDAGLAKLAETEFYIGKFHLAAKHYEIATESLLSSLDTFDSNVPNGQMSMAIHAFLIRAYEEQGMREQATKHCQAIGAKTPITDDQDYLPIYLPSPSYPRNAQRAGDEGYAIVELTVDKNGFVKDPIAVEVKGHNGFRAASIEGAKKFRYAPRYVDGQPVETEGVRYKFLYNLRGSKQLPGY